MKIDLDKYIRANRSQLDEIEQIDVDQMWADFESRKTPVRKIKRWRYWAAAVGILLIGISFLFSGAKDLNPDELVFQKLSEVDPDLAAEQTKMMKNINAQGILIKEMGISEQQFPELFEELKILDSLQLETINDLENFVDRKNLLRTLLRHYQRKARILELMLYEHEKQENETAYESSKQI